MGLGQKWLSLGVWGLVSGAQGGLAELDLPRQGLGTRAGKGHGLNGAGSGLGSRPRFRARQKSEVSQAARTSWACSSAASQDHIPMMDSQWQEHKAAPKGPNPICCAASSGYL